MAERTAVGNPLLVVKEAMPGHVEGLKVKRDKLVAQIRELNVQIAEAETLMQVAPLPVPEEEAP